ncbi:hypothetical protein [Actinosynnema sp. NPDC020468]|uniref:hypothetical protein n=1 Tax=Actinosynnema sp. NPDC020468 TaxID=3154488 RepID=UPI0033E6DEAE
MRRFHIIAPVVCAALTLGACGPTPAAAPSSTSAVAAGATSTTPSVDAAAEGKAVRAAFDGYKKAALDKDGAAARLLSSSMRGFYDNAKKLALTGSEVDVVASGPSSAVTVYVLRAEIDPARLRSMSAQDLMTYAVEQGLIGEKSVEKLEVGEPVVTGDTAKAPVLVQGADSGMSLDFLKEDGAWRIDLSPLLALADQALAAVAKQQNLSVEQLIDATLAQRYGAAAVAGLKHPLEG